MTDGFDVKKFVESFPTLVATEGSAKRLRSMVLKLGLAGRLGTTDSREPRPSVVVKSKGALTANAPHPNWVACGLEDLAEVAMGNSPPGESYNDHGDGVPLINGPVEFSAGPFGATKRTKFTTAPARMCKKGDLLVCVRGATTGRTNIAAFDACIGRGVAAVRARGSQGYLNYFMWSVGNDLLAAGTGTTFPAISRDDLAALVVLLPPLAEQKRIVAKVDELMKLIDDLEAKREKAWDVQARFRASALDALTNAGGAVAVAAAWRRVAGNFDLLFGQAGSVLLLRKVVLEAAMRGAFTEKRAPKGAVSELIESARVDVRQRNATRRGVKRPEPRPVDEREHPPLPPGWAAVRWAEVGWSQNGRAFPSNDYSASGVRLLRPGNLHVSGALVWTSENTRHLPEDYANEYPDFIVRPGELVMNLTAQSLKDEFLGRVCLSGPDERCLLNQRIARLGTIALRPAFALWYFRTPFFRRYVDGLNQGTLIQHMFTSQVDDAVVIVPPLEEQDQAVARIKALMKLCDDLEAKLKAKEGTASKLVEAVVRELVA